MFCFKSIDKKDILHLIIYSKGGYYLAQGDEEKIEFIRREMIQAGIQFGLKNERTIELSKELDCLLNKFEKSKFTKKMNLGKNFSSFF